MAYDTPIYLIWGCNPERQYESSWIRFLLSSAIVEELHSWHPEHLPLSLSKGATAILVETGLFYLERFPSNEKISRQLHARARRTKYLSTHSNLIILHLSDEQGFDADVWYPRLPKESNLWRNFYHSRLSALEHIVTSFPIGPRREFLDFFDSNFVIPPSISRSYPWAFMGTIWSSGSRNLAVSLFLHSLPNGYYFGGSQFGQGIPLNEYRSVLLNSVFSLAPEGDRHLDTFRLWESLCSGCLPLIVDHNNTSRYLIPEDFPLPIFCDWHNALDFAKIHLRNPQKLHSLQLKVISWWRSFATDLRHSLVMN